MTACAIMAGGTGSRLIGFSVPKQFLPLNGKPIIIYTIEAFLEIPEIDMLYIGIHPMWEDKLNEEIDKYLYNYKNKIKVLAGGGTRTDTLLNTVKAAEHDLGENTVLLTHDAVRPFVSKQSIIKSIELARAFGASVCAVPSIDTVAVSAGGSVVESVPNRTSMYLIQTPQTFVIKSFKECMSKLSQDKINTLTDASGAFVAAGAPIHIAPGSYENFKITTNTDYERAKHMINSIYLDNDTIKE